jgi:restriction system protein
MDWFQFEKLMEICYQAHGYRVIRRGGARADGGIDLLIEKDGTSAAVQCKHWKSWKVGVRNVRELKGAMSIENIPKGILVTVVGYSEEAQQLGRKQGIALLNVERLADLIEAAGLASNEQFTKNLYDETKYCPKCEKRLVQRIAEKGPNRGKPFWVCPGFPQCRYLIHT